jgi:hypothetical protein
VGQKSRCCMPSSGGSAPILLTSWLAGPGTFLVRLVEWRGWLERHVEGRKLVGKPCDRHRWVRHPKLAGPPVLLAPNAPSGRSKKVIHVLPWRLRSPLWKIQRDQHCRGQEPELLLHRSSIVLQSADR